MNKLDEWIVEYQGLWLNLTGRENETFLGDAEFDSELEPDGKWNIQICVDDFINSGPAVWQEFGRPTGLQIVFHSLYNKRDIRRLGKHGGFPSHQVASEKSPL